MARATAWRALEVGRCTVAKKRELKRWVFHVSDLRPYLAPRYPHLSQGQILAIIGSRASRETVNAALVALFQSAVLGDLGDKVTASAKDQYWTPDWGNGWSHAMLHPGGMPGLSVTLATITVRDGLLERCVLHYRPGVSQEMPLLAREGFGPT